jgi:hypothetical protein
MWVAEKLHWKGLKIKKSVGNRKIVMSISDIGPERINSLTPELNPSAQRFLPRDFNGNFNF